MINRLSQLQHLAGQTIQTSSDQEMSNGSNYEEPEIFQGIDEIFIEEIKSIKLKVSALNANNHKIQTLKNKYGKAIKAAHEKDLSDEMNTILSENASMQKEIKKSLSEIEKKVKEAEENEPHEPQTKMKKNYYFSLTKQVSQVLKKQQSFQDEYKMTVKGKVSRQVRLIDPNLDEEQVQEYIEKPQMAQQMLQKKIYGQASVMLKNTVSDIQDKFRDIKKLEASVNQCVELFNELSNLVHAQGQKIDSIEAHVADCKDYIVKAEVKLKKAKQHQECSKKCMCFLILGGLVVLIIIIIVVLTNS